MQYKKSNDMLILRGVFLKDFMKLEDKFDQIVIEQAGVDYNTSIVVYDEIPEYFTSVEEWIKSAPTNLKCWNCDLLIEKLAIPSISDVFVDKNEQQKMKVEGVFCEFNCAEQYIDIFYKRNMSWNDRKKYLRILYRLIKGKTIDIIKVNPSKTIREEYCGSKYGISTTEYRALIKNINTNCELSKYKIDQVKEMC